MAALGALNLVDSSGVVLGSGSAMQPVGANTGASLQKMSGADSMKEVFNDIRDGISNLGLIFSKKISGLNSHLAFRLETLNATMTTIGEILAEDLGIEKEKFNEMLDERQDADKQRSLADEEDDDKPKGIFGGIKDAFGGLMDFLTPKSDLMKVGLAGLFAAGVIFFRKEIEAAFTAVFKYLGSLKDAFDEEGFTGVKNKLQKDIKENVINPTLASIGMRVKEDGTLGLIQGSFLDKANPFGGPTNIFKTLNAFRTGINPYDNNSKMYPEWYYKGFMENLDDLLTPEDPDMLVNAVKNTMNNITKGMSDFFTDTEISTPDGTFTQKSGMSKMKDQMMENFRNNMQSIADFFHDDQGNLFGIDFKALTDLLPTIQEIAESIYNSLPKYLRFDTVAEKNIDRDVERLEDIDFFNKDYIGKSVITRSNIDQASPEELKSLLSKESDDLKPDDIRFIENKIIEKERLIEKTSTTALPSFTTTATNTLKTQSLEKLVKEKAAINATPPGNITVMTDAKKVSTINTSNKTDVIASDFRTDPMELSAQEQMNFFRNRAGG